MQEDLHGDRSHGRVWRHIRRKGNVFGNIRSEILGEGYDFVNLRPPADKVEEGLSGLIERVFCRFEGSDLTQ